MPENLVSRYAPAGRSDRDTIDRQKRLLADYYGSLRQLYDAVSELILIVNQDRQIVFFNSVVPSLLGVDSPESLYGLRPGEALGCIYSCRNPGGCGTSEFCSQCGAVNAILAALSNKADLQECRMLRNDDVEAFDLLVRTTPLEIQGQMFTIMAIIDISHEKRRRTLERIFFHDIMSTVATINLCVKKLYAEPDSKNAAGFKQNLMRSVDQLIDELRSQRELLAAENNELMVKMRPVDGHLLVSEVVEAFRDRFGDHTIVLDDGQVGNLILNTDRALLQRVLGNMILNAIEASRPGEVIDVSCGVKDEHIEFRVHNACDIPKEIQVRIFQRSFSTKGAGRGLGTYSIKLLSERYLNGSVGFSSSPEHGTTFVARYPL
jgi:K+-sensing histidine kinase KdpD